jgi:hypothetical protein
MKILSVPGAGTAVIAFGRTIIWKSEVAYGRKTRQTN